MKKQQQKQLTAHDKVIIFRNFHYLLEGLEEYIGKAKYYPDWDSRRKLKNITIPKEQAEKASVDDAEDFFLTNLVLYVSMANEAPDSFRKGELMNEYYKWIGEVGINPNNCPEKLKQFLVEIKNVLEGNSERIVQQTKEHLANIDKGKEYPTDPKDVISLFSAIQTPLNKNREEAKSYEGKNYWDVEVKSKFNSNEERGEQVFNQIAGGVSGNQPFRFFSQKDNSKDDDTEMVESWLFGSQQQSSSSNANNTDIVRQYELAKAKLRGEVPLESWETWEGLRQWVSELERSQWRAQQQQRDSHWGKDLR